VTQNELPELPVDKKKRLKKVWKEVEKMDKETAGNGSNATCCTPQFDVGVGVEESPLEEEVPSVEEEETSSVDVGAGSELEEDVGSADDEGS